MDVRAVALKRGFRFTGNIDQFGDGSLHAEGHFVLGDAGVGFRVAGLLELFLVEGVEAIEHLAAEIAGDAGGIGEVEDRIALGTERDALVFGGEETTTPKAGVESLGITFGGPGGIEDDEGGEIFVFAAESVAEPCAEAGTAGDLVAGLDVGDGWIVIDGLGVETADDGEVIDHFGGVGEQFADPGARLAVLFEFVDAGSDGETFLAGGHSRKALTLADRIGQVFIVPFLHLGFVVPRGRVGTGRQT